MLKYSYMRNLDLLIIINSFEREREREELEVFIDIYNIYILTYK